MATDQSGADAEARLILDRRAAFDAAAWEVALAERDKMPPLPLARAPQLPVGPPRPGFAPAITITPPRAPVDLGSLSVSGKATGGFNPVDRTWNAIDDISVQVDGGPLIQAVWQHEPGDPIGEVTWSATVQLPALGQYQLSATVTADTGVTGHSQVTIPVTVDPFRWLDVGPDNLAGCVLHVVVDPTNTDRLYAASCDGGVWRLDSVATYPSAPWVPLTDGQPTLSLACVAVARLDGRIYYADQLQYLYSSADRGGSWTRTSTTQLGIAFKLIVHPDDPDTVYAATTTGLWFTGDGGANWSNLNPGKITDAAMDPVDSSILYIGQPDTGILKSYNSGLIWLTILPRSASNSTWPMLKLAVGALGSVATRTVAAKWNEEVWVNRASGNNGVGPNGWVRKAVLGNMGQWDWDHVIAVNPFDDNVILVGGQTLYRTTDGGQTWAGVVQAGGGDPTHEDQQSLAFDPCTPGIVYLSNDGGVWRSIDGGQTWATGNVGADISERRNLNKGLVTAQFFRTGTAGNNGLGDLMHSGIIGSTDLAGRSWVGVEGHAWEGAEIYSDPRRPQYFVVTGTLCRRRWPSTGPGDFAIPWGTPSFLPGGGGLTSAVHSVASDPRPTSSTVIAGTQNPGRIMRGDGSLDSPTWTAMPGISIGNEPIVSIDFAASFPGRAYAISRAGHLFRKDDVNDDVVAPAWTPLGQWLSPTGSEVRQMVVNPQDAERVYVITGQEIVRWTPAAGWISIKGTGPRALQSSDLYSLVADPRLNSTLYVGAQVGVFVSPDDGANWYTFSEFLPNALIGQIFWDAGYLYATTYGRGLWRRRPS
jgi:photosystem II stability/assembly factor-like uncharacterized protein